MRIALLLAGLLCALAAFRPVFIPENTILTGKVTDDKGEALIGASVKILRGADLELGRVTDYNGEYRFQVEPGTYDVEFNYTGYTTQRVSGIQVLAGQINTLDATMNEGTVLSEAVITAYKVPLIQQDQTSSGQTISTGNWPASGNGSGRQTGGSERRKSKAAAPAPLTSDQIRNMPTRPANAIVATTAGAKPGDGAVNIRGSRSNNTNYYIDGIRVQGAPPPVTDIEQLRIATGSLGAEYGDVTGGVISPLVLPAQPEKKDEEGRTDDLKQVSDTVAPPDDYTDEQYNAIIENPFLDAAGNPLSTFSIDVDAASYANLRRYINDGQLPPADAVRIEEMINYFDYQYATPTDGHPFAVHTELAACPWQPRHQLLLVNLQGQVMDVGQLPASNLVFLVDVSGSMNSEDKLPLVIQSLELLTDQLRPQDRVAVVVYAGAAGMVLPSTTGDKKAAIKSALQKLSAGGSTAGGAGIQLAYKIARDNFMPGGNNRVILCTDGDFNVGLSSENELVKLIERERESGVFLTVLGFGTGNYQDGTMQSLADKGNGNHAYIDQIGEAQKVLVREFGGTLFAIAKDVKLQLEFNPAKVAGYRLIGYENRMLAKEDFNDDTKDAGELGAGHRVTALYEIVPVGEPLPFTAPVDPLKYQLSPLTEPVTAAVASNDLLTLKLRYKSPRGNQPSRLLEVAVPATLSAAPSDNFLLATSVAEFGLLLRGSKFKGNATWPQLSARAAQAAKTDRDGYRREFAELVEKAWRLADPMTAGK